MWGEILRIGIIIGLIGLLYLVTDTLYMFLKQRIIDCIPIKQKKLQRVKIHNVGPEVLELMRRKKLTTLIFDDTGVYTLRRKRDD